MDFQAALEYSIRFPKMYEDYLSRYQAKKLNLYESYLFEEDGQKIINMACYDSYAFPTTLEAVEKTLKYFVKHYASFGVTEVAFPLLGCDEDGLRMVNVLPIMEKYLKPLPIECYICFDVEGASNLELQMMEAFKTMDLAPLQEYAQLSSLQLASLEAFKEHLVRFEDIFHIEGLRPIQYRAIYQYYYNGEYKKLHPFHQESLF